MGKSNWCVSFFVGYITSGAGSMVVITGENPPASSFHPYFDGIFRLAKVSLYQICWKCALLIA